MAFVIQGEGLDAYGDHASAMGYGGFAVSPDNGIRNSLAIEFDDFGSNAWNDPNGNHISIHTLFAAPNSQDENTASIGIAANPPPFGQFSGSHMVMIEYANGVLSVYMDDLLTPQVSAPVDLALALGGSTGWVGFTGSGGALFCSTT